MSSFDRSFGAFSAIAALPGAIVSEAFGVVGQVFGAAERVVREGLAEEVNLSFSVFGRKVGFQGELFLLDKKPEA
jgi:hypothetical protein